MYYNYTSELLLLRGLKPSDYDRLGLFLGCCFVWRVKHQRHYTVRACLKNLYRMLDLNRHPLLHTTSRRAAPLGDPRGIPKLSRKFSLRKCYLRIGERAFTSVHNFKFEGSVNIFVASTSPTRKYFQVNIDLAKMSASEEMNFSIYSFFDGLLQELGDTMEFVSDEVHMPILSDEELDFTSDFNIDMLNMDSEVSTPLSDNNEAARPPPTQDEDQATIVINIQNELDLIWNPLDISPLQPVEISPLQPVDISPLQSVEISPLPPVDISPLQSVEISPLQPVDISQLQPVDLSPLQPLEITNEQTEREKNNDASRAYRQRKKAKLAAQEEELEVLEKKNRELSVKASALEDIVKELKSKVVSLLANESVGGVKRNHEAEHIVRKKCKKS